MIVLICKDSATQVPREVKSLEEAQAFAIQGFDVLVQGEDGSKIPLAQAIAQAAGLELFGTLKGVPVYAKPMEPVPAKPQGIVAKVKAAVTSRKK